jgi:glycosyltransferase involved in cell wall biosynthesis
MSQNASRVDLSIVIPTFNRPDALAHCLASIAQQELPEGAEREVLVMNDGGDPKSGDVCEAERAQSGLPIDYRGLNHMGPGAIRNRAVEFSRGHIILFLNDDVTLRPGHLAAHLSRHAHRPGHAARGQTIWAAECADSDFMEWVMRQSFFYYLIDDFENCGYEYWHTSDLSVDRRWLEGEKAILFSEEFPFAGYEDTEWGWRLEQAGCQLAFLPSAVTEHHHIYTPEALAERGRRNGVSGAILLDHVPELENRAIRDFLEAPLAPKPSLLRKMASVARALLSGGDKGESEIDRQTREWRRTFSQAYIEGFQEEYQKRHGHPYQPPD